MAREAQQQGSGIREPEAAHVQPLFAALLREALKEAAGRLSIDCIDLDHVNIDIKGNMRCIIYIICNIIETYSVIRDVFVT